MEEDSQIMSSRPQSRAREQTSTVRNRAFLIFTIIFPVIFLVITEFSLRATGYGPDLSLFRIQEFSGKSYYNMNPGVKARYFSRVEFNPMTSLDFFEPEKDPETFRIFCLGGSTTAGYPYGYVGSFSSFLKQRLVRLFPERSFEMVNLGLTATNSFTSLDFVDEVLEFDPDLIIVYDGHNEFYGAMGLASHESAGQSRWISNLSLHLVHFRTFLLLRDIYTSITKSSGSPDDGPGGTMMQRLALGQTVRYGSPLYNRTLDAFEANLRDLLELCTDRGVPVIVSSQVSNLRDLEPFVSGETELPSAEKLRFQRAYKGGLQHLIGGDADSAALSLSEAAGMDTISANARYYLGRALAMSGNSVRAFDQFSDARDLDELRFRQSSDFNRAAKRITEESGHIFVDIEQVFRDASIDAIPGSSLLHEHLHPNARGYFLMGRAYAEAMRAHGLPEHTWPPQDSLAESELWSERWMTEVDERAAKRRTDILTSSWPFRGEPVPLIPADSSDRIGMIVDAMLDGELAWEQSHVAAAGYYESIGDLARVEREYEALIAMTPKNVSPYLQLGRVYLKQLQYAAAHDILEQSIGIEPTLYGLRALGAIAVDMGDPAGAIPYLRQAMRQTTSQGEITELYFMIAIASGRAGNDDAARENLRIVLERDPSFTRARRMLEQMDTAG
ncbi:MAG: GDSL-type esterase/lipase family protein [Ignavibacteria bacterium]|nr:GDSL-type esterase/lipase family protein [Ignavibacteria bacterium]